MDSTMSTTAIFAPDGIPILKRMTALEPELETPLENLVAEGKLTSPVSEDEGYEAEKESKSEEESEESEGSEESETTESKDAEIVINTSSTSPIWVWLSVAVIGLAYFWGIAYALSPIKTAYPPK